jgi:hypothetical protein
MHDSALLINNFNDYPSSRRTREQSENEKRAHLVCILLIRLKIFQKTGRQNLQAESHSNPDGTKLASFGAAAAAATRTCKVCKTQFRMEDNGPCACRHHPGHYSGRLNRIGTTYLEEQHEQQVRATLLHFRSAVNVSEYGYCRLAPHG